ncbi:MAG: hypothetical protein KatS3mg093_103 [Candidatus Parcubacteria bacterium]|nr:MAG: hypothetical protein KatS3mg093_103 [Candidatus Parcubacteria bacterium]
MMAEEKVMDFLDSNDFYRQFLELAKFLNIDSVGQFLKFVSLFKFLDDWFRDNWNDEETKAKSNELLTYFSEEEISKIIDYLNQNFKEQRESLWQQEKVENNFDEEKERRYLEIMASLVKFPEVEQGPNQDLTNEKSVVFSSQQNQSIVTEENEKNQPLVFSAEENENKLTEESEIETSQSNIDEPSEKIATISIDNNPELKTEIDKTKDKPFDNIIISYKKGEEQEGKDEEKFLDLSNL